MDAFVETHTKVNATITDLTAVGPFGNSRKYRHANQGLEGNGSQYAFLLRLEGPSREAMRLTKTTMEAELGATPSNPAIFDHLMFHYLKARGKL